MLLLLDIGQSAGLGVNVLDLARALSVELDNLTASVGGASLLKVRVEASEEVVGAVGEAVALVSGASTVGSVVLLVQVLDGAQEAGRDVVLGVKLDGMLDGGIANDVAVSEVLSQDTGTGLLFLCNVVRLALRVGGTTAGNLFVGMGAGDGDVVGAKLSVVEQQSSLHSSLLLKGDVCALGLALSGELDVGNLATGILVSNM